MIRSLPPKMIARMLVVAACVLSMAHLARAQEPGPAAPQPDALPDALKAEVARCETDYRGEACTLLGAHFQTGIDVTWDAAKALSWYEAGCNYDDATGCALAAMLLLHGNGVEKDPMRAGELIRKAATAREPFGTWMASGVEAGQRVAKEWKSDKRLKTRFDKACSKLDMGSACTILSVASLLGVWGGKDVKQAFKLASRACELQDGLGCSRQGRCAEGGWGTTKDPKEARRLYRKACDMGDSWGCKNLGVMYYGGDGGSQDKAEARRLFQKACDMGDGLGCNNLGWMYDEGEGGSQDKAEARRLYQKACDMGSSWACRALGWTYEKGEGGSQDKAKARRLYQKACDMGLPEGCTAQGWMCKEGEGGSSDKAEAKRLFEKACDMGDGWGCNNLGVMYEEGDGVPESKAKACKLYKRACDLGETEYGCANYESTCKGTDSGKDEGKDRKKGRAVEPPKP